ncbi:MAG: hypothetical protein QOD83_2904 [Solirubrobacteraceae bacterium]|jgi:hypothetical protein|nr:hypothetical protein [Solirubrobacteraceae bacterium]
MPEVGDLTDDQAHWWDGHSWTPLGEPAVGQRTADHEHWWNGQKYKSVAWTIPKSYFAVILMLMVILLIMVGASLWGPKDLPKEVVGLASTVLGGLLGLLVPSPVKR